MPEYIKSTVFLYGARLRQQSGLGWGLTRPRRGSSRLRRRRIEGRGAPHRRHSRAQPWGSNQIPWPPRAVRRRRVRRRGKTLDGRGPLPAETLATLPGAGPCPATPDPHSKGCGAPAPGPGEPKGARAASRYGRSTVAVVTRTAAWRRPAAGARVSAPPHTGGGADRRAVGFATPTLIRFHPSGLSQPFAPTLPAAQTARLPRRARLAWGNAPPAPSPVQVVSYRSDYVLSHSRQGSAGV